MKTVKLCKHDEDSLKYFAQIMNEFHNQMESGDKDIVFLDTEGRNITAITLVLLQNMGRVVEKYKQAMGIT
jgi:hypothetical protein